MNLKTSKTEIMGKPAVCGLILCAGVGARSGLAYNKLLHYVGKKTILEMTLDAFSESCCTALILTAHENDMEKICAIAAEYKGITVILGGATRAESVRLGLKAAVDCDIVVIHDGARPYIQPHLIDLTVQSALLHGSGILAVPAVDTIKEVNGEDIVRTLQRDNLFHVQTPQTFVYTQIADAYNRVPGNAFDDSEVFLKAGYLPKIVLGDYANSKVTLAEDFFRVASTRCKIGTGFDVHRLIAGRKLILGGVHIPFVKGLDGHSDADVLTHAVMDALLSAAQLPDIGVLFPDNDTKFKDADSVALLQKVHALITGRGFTIGNISAVVMAEQPKLAPTIQKICVTLAESLSIHPNQINVSATTTEKLGIIGEEQGIAASATCLLHY